MLEDTEAKKYLLVVDDDPHIRKICADVLRKSDLYQVQTAENGEEALKLLSESNFAYDLVLTDVQMPKMTGEQLIQAVLPDHPRIAFIVFTAYKNDQNVLRCLKLGAVDYLEKPISVEKLLQIVRRALDRHDRFSGEEGELDITSEVQGWVEITAPTDFEYVERFQKFTALLGNIPLGDEAKEDIRVAVDELGQNAVEWGNRGDRHKRIHLSYCVFPDRIVFKIEDEGEGFSPGGLRDPSVDPLAHIMERMKEGKRAGGYGVYITRQLMDDVQYNDKGNVVLLTKHFRGQAADQAQ